MTEYFSFFDAVETAPNIYDREYNAQQFTDYFKSLVTTGVMKGNGEQLEVTADGSSMNSSIGNGVAFIEGRYYYNDDSISHIHDTETLGLNRIDRVVIRMDLNTNARYVKSFIKKGAPSSNPVAPSLTQNNDIYEISLAQVKIIGGQTFINAQDVKDDRGTEVICPWAGSSILPNFDDSALGDLVESQMLKDGKVIDLTNPVGNIDDTLKSGFYYASSNEGTTGTLPGTDGWFVQIYSFPETSISNGYTLQIAYPTIKSDTPVRNPNQRIKLVGGPWSTWLPCVTVNQGSKTVKGIIQVGDNINVTSGVISVPKAGNITAGVTTVLDSLSSTSTTEAVSANALRLVNNTASSKASKEGQGSVSVSLTNGWTGTIKAFKDGINRVHVYVDISGGTTSESTTIGTLPIGYRPTQTPTNRYAPAVTLSDGWTSPSSVLLAYGSTGSIYIGSSGFKKSVICDFSFEV